MRNKAELTLTPNDATQILTDCGLGIGYDKLSAALRKGGIFNFGVAFEMPSGFWAYIIYRKKLYDFIRENGGTPPDAFDSEDMRGTIATA